MEFRDNQNTNKLSQNEERFINGGFSISECKPTQENELGVYKEGEAWVVGLMQERGTLFEVGRFVDENTAHKEAEEYKELLDNLFK